ncbi:YgeY family selenium metabolism-linked hydrolase, partial [candidate division KSB1 bacterium]|nr:YgeY family selenium metabolism-linked hydrolase [candidate division KSB1 bacterium]
MHEVLKHAKFIEPNLVQFLKDVMKFPHGSGKEGEVIARIKQEMEAIGYDEVKVDKLG